MLDLAFSPITFTSQRLALDEYWLVTAAASYQVAPGVELFGRVENLLDQDYEEVFGYNSAGVAAYAGLRFTYEEPSTLEWAQYK
jgi:vitamin B12 transporter